jgi:hypothetical protein
MRCLPIEFQRFLQCYTQRFFEFLKLREYCLIPYGVKEPGMRAHLERMACECTVGSQSTGCPPTRA